MVNYSPNNTNRLESRLKDFIGRIYLPILKSRYDPEHDFFGFDASRLVSEYQVVPRFMYIGLVQLKDYRVEKKKQGANQSALRRRCRAETESLYESSSFRGPFPVMSPEAKMILNRVINEGLKKRVAREAAEAQSSAHSDISDKL